MRVRFVPPAAPFARSRLWPLGFYSSSDVEGCSVSNVLGSTPSPSPLLTGKVSTMNTLRDTASLKYSFKVVYG